VLSHFLVHDNCELSCCCCTAKIEALMFMSPDARKSPSGPSSGNSIHSACPEVCGEDMPWRLPTK